MAAPTTIRFGKFLVKLGNGASPEVYAAPCGFTTKALTLTKNLQDINLPDCDDPDAPAWVGRDVQSLSAAINGEGVLAFESADEWFAAFDDTDSVSVKVEIIFPTLTYAYTGLMHLTELALGAEQGGRVTANVQMQSDGQLTRTMVTT